MPVKRAICVAKNLLDKHTYDVYNTPNPTEEQIIELTHEEADALIRNFNPETPLVWNHGLDIMKNKPIGRVFDVYKKDGALFVLAEEDDSIISDLVTRGAITNASLAHSRNGPVSNYTIDDVSYCDTGRRDGTGIIKLDTVVCSSDQTIAQQSTDLPATQQPDIVIPPAQTTEAPPAASTQTPIADPPPATQTPVADPAPVPMTDVPETPTFDAEGFLKFQANVDNWQKNGVKPEDWDEKEDLTVQHYQMRRYANNTFMDDKTSMFMIQQLERQLESDIDRSEREAKERKELNVKLASVVDSIARKYPSSNGARITDEQREEARRRLIMDTPEAADIAPEVLHQLCEVRASMDAQKVDQAEQQTEQAQPAKMDVDDDKTIELERLRLQQEQAKVRQLELQAEIAKRDMSHEKIKHNQKMEAVQGITNRLKSHSRYSVPEPEDQPRAKQMRMNAGHSYNPYEKWGVDPQNPSWSMPRNPWARPNKNGKGMRSIHEFALDHGMEEAHQQWRPDQLQHGLGPVLCSKDYQKHMEKKKMNDPLNHCLDLASLIFGQAATDPTHRLSTYEGRIRRMPATEGAKVIEQYGFEAGSNYGSNGYMQLR